jgi:hypothetical protein
MLTGDGLASQWASVPAHRAHASCKTKADSYHRAVLRASERTVVKGHFTEFLAVVRGGEGYQAVAPNGWSPGPAHRPTTSQ